MHNVNYPNSTTVTTPAGQFSVQRRTPATIQSHPGGHVERNPFSSAERKALFARELREERQVFPDDTAVDESND